jgi:hypothetical protein
MYGYDSYVALVYSYDKSPEFFPPPNDIPIGTALASGCSVVLMHHAFLQFRENALAYIEETLSDEEDKPEMFKRSPRRGAWWRRVRDRLRRFRDRLRNVGRRICRFLRNSSSQSKF